jgi:hypothetical protein
MNKNKKIILGLAYVFLYLGIGPFVSPAYAQVDTFKVVKVIDGETIAAAIRGKNETVKLLGINTPNICSDGTCSDAAHHQGACSHHGGVAQWL